MWSPLSRVVALVAIVLVLVAVTHSSAMAMFAWGTPSIFKLTWGGMHFVRCKGKAGGTPTTSAISVAWRYADNGFGSSKIWYIF